MSDRKMKVVVNGKPYVVEVSDPMASSMRVTVSGKVFDVEVEMEGAAEVVKSTPAAPKPTLAKASPAPAPAAPPPPAAPGSDNDIRSPMPGVVLDIAVKPGDKVTVGQQVCALDAMKMKNAIRSPIEGVIASVDVSDGQKVAYGQVLIRFE